MKLSIKKGTTSKRIAVFIQDSSSTTGDGLTGVLFSDITGYSWREDAGNVAAAAITLATATRGTWASGGFIEKDATNMPGWYEFGIPNALLLTAASWVEIHLKGATDMAPLVMEIQLVDNHAKDVHDRVGAPIAASISADIQVIDTEVAALPVANRVEMDSNSTQLSTLVAGVDVTKINGSTAAAIALALSAGTIVSGTVDTAVTPHVPTLTEFQADDITDPDPDHWLNRAVIWVGGPLANQVGAIQASVRVGALTQFTISAQTQAPANNQAFIII